MVIGTFLLCALLAGAAFWFIGWLCTRLGAPAWAGTILSGATLVYVFWFLTSIGPITIGR